MDSSPPPPFRWSYAEFDDGNFQLPGRALLFIAGLFVIILVTSLLFIYTRWVCRRRQTPPTPPLPQRGGAGDNVPVFLYKNIAAARGRGECFGDQAECCICLGILGDNEKVKMLPECRHCFHSECVDTWFMTQSSCPLCRASLRVSSPV